MGKGWTKIQATFRRVSEANKTSLKGSNEVVWTKTTHQPFEKRLNQKPLYNVKKKYIKDVVVYLLWVSLYK